MHVRQVAAAKAPMPGRLTGLPACGGPALRVPVVGTVPPQSVIHGAHRLAQYPRPRLAHLLCAPETEPGAQPREVHIVLGNLPARVAGKVPGEHRPNVRQLL